jgi:hypothetical protein
MQVDVAPIIRINTTICMSLIAPYIAPNDQKEKENILVAAFTRALKDPLPMARKAAVQGILNNVSV